MHTTKSMIIAVVLGAPALMFGACSSSTNSPADGGSAGGEGGAAGATAGTDGGTDVGAAGTDAGAAGSDAGTDSGADGGIPAVPTLGAQIDRVGRPAINTALTDPFDSSSATHDTKEDAYNALTPTTASTFEAAFEANLAILDSLDTMCGNQFAADTTKHDATRYKPLADVLLDDQLYLNTSYGTCATYLAVEANATNIIPNTDCGGRVLTDDVIDESYSVLAIGALSGVHDGVDADDKTTSATVFPFLAAPN